MNEGLSLLWRLGPFLWPIMRGLADAYAGFGRECAERVENSRRRTAFHPRHMIETSPYQQ